MYSKSMFDDLITSKTRIKILHLFLENLGEMFHVREIVRRVEEEINAVRRELLLLDKKGILSREARANRVYYFLNNTYPFYHDLIKIHFPLLTRPYKNTRKRIRIRT